MTEQTSAANATDLRESMRRALETVDRLEISVEQLLQLLKQRNLQVSLDLSGLVRGLRRDLSSTNQIVGQSAAKIQQLQELVRTSALINSSLELDRVLEDVIDTVVLITGAERAYLMLREPESGELVPRTARNWERQSLSENDVTFSSTIVNAAIEAGQPILTNNFQDDPRFKSGSLSLKIHGARSILCIPLLLRDKPVGVLYVDKRIQRDLFSPDILPILGAFANQAATAIENARLFGQVRADLHKAQKEVMELRIQIDEQSKEKQIREITDTEYFRELEAMARKMRKRGEPDSEQKGE